MDLTSCEPTPCCDTKPIRNDESITSRLNRRKAQLVSELNDINAALELLDSVPDVQKVMDAISRVSCRY